MFKEPERSLILVFSDAKQINEMSSTFLEDDHIVIEAF